MAAAAARSRRAFFISAVGNLSVQYNLSCLGIAVAFMTSHRDSVVTHEVEVTADFPEPHWATTALFGTVFAGAMLGMIAMGWVGDQLGRRAGMIATLAFVVAGALGSALLTWGSPDTIYGVLAVCRFVLGFGVGGIYPMAAATAHEGDDGPEKDGTASAADSRVAWAFFFQAPGAMLPYLLGLVLFLLPKAEWTTSVQFRVVFGCGALVALVPLLATIYSSESSPRIEPDCRHDIAAAGSDSPSPESARDTTTEPDEVAPADIETHHLIPTTISAVPALSRKTELDEGSYTYVQWLTLIGTGGAWFLYDVSFYATNVFMPAILAGILGDSSDSIVTMTCESLAVTLLGIPACAASILVLKRLGGQRLSTYGFLFIAMSFAALACSVSAYPDSHEGLKFALFALVTISLNAGPNVTTYVLPASLFPRRVRGTFHGLSAAAGKAGAVFGAFVFPMVVANAGIGGVLWMQVCVAVLGAAVSWLFLAEKLPALPP